MTEVVASIAARDPEDTARQCAQAAGAGADWIELRLDEWPAGADLRPVLAAAPRPVLVTCRLPRDGGRFAGSAAERRELLRAALAGGARGVDLEDWEEWVPAPRPPRVIRSLHADGLPRDLAATRDALLARGDVAKIAVRVRDLAAAAPLLALLAQTDQRRAPTVAFALDAIGTPTRILAACLGAPLVYGCVAAGAETAAGQPTIAELTQLYRVAERGPRTRFCGVLGASARGSFGPFVHNRAFAQLGVDAVYLALETARPEEAIAMLPRDRLRGLSVTNPYKERMRALCGSCDAAAQECVAVNTLCWHEGQVTGHNTDPEGVRHALAQGRVVLAQGETAAVLGGGGAARAAALALDRLGAAVTVLARDPGPALRGCAAARGWRLAPFAAPVLRELRPRVVVHATPVGGGDDGSRVLPEWTPAPGTAVLDLVYRPARTRLLEEASAAGAIALSGVDMFLGQAAAQVELFTGQRLAAAALAGFLP